MELILKGTKERPVLEIDPTTGRIERCSMGPECAYREGYLCRLTMESDVLRQKPNSNWCVWAGNQELPRAA